MGHREEGSTKLETLARQAFLTRIEAQNWLLRECDAGSYRPKNPSWIVLHSHYLRNGKNGAIYYKRNAEMYIATVYRSEYWENKVKGEINNA